MSIATHLIFNSDFLYILGAEVVGKMAELTGPYLNCRNPMAFGTISHYLGIVILIGSISSLKLWMMLTAALLSYIKFIEEKELQTRFGEEYLEYKQRVPFLIPRRR